MKKVTRIIGAICMMGLLTFVSTSCKKDQENVETTVNLAVSGFEEDGERAYINANFNFLWHKNDAIRVFNLAAEEDADESSTAIYTKVGNTNSSDGSARFRGPSLGSKKAEGYRLWYPVDMIPGTADEINLNLWNDNRQVFHVSDHQQFEAYSIPDVHPNSKVDGQAMPMAIDVESLTGVATLKQIFGVAAFQMAVDPDYIGDVVVDSVKLIDDYHNLTGDVSLKLHEVVADSLTAVSDKYFDVYQEFSQEYVQNVLAPCLNKLGWMPSNQGKEITLNCCYKHQGSDFATGEMMSKTGQSTEFAILLRPLALSEGFHLYVYANGSSTPIIMTQADFYRPNQHPLDYTWATKVQTYKRYILTNTLDTYLH